MTVVLAGPRTHALVIGIGAYPHLVGGVGTLSPDAGGRGQLTSPPVSADAFARWLLAEYDYPDKPLGSLHLATTDSAAADWPGASDLAEPDADVVVTVGDATLDAIAEAVGRWHDRVQTDPGSRAVFYFCGHGASRGDDTTLLASDFGSSRQNPMDHTINFRLLRLALSTSAAAEQIFFIDACRTGDSNLIGEGRGAGRQLLRGDEPQDSTPPPISFQYYATVPGGRAWAAPGKVSVYTSALLRGLRGGGSDDADGSWRVTTYKLAEAAAHYAKASGPHQDQEPLQRPQTGLGDSFDLTNLPGPPLVPVSVRCAPEEDDDRISFTFTDVVGGLPAHADHASFRVDVGRWELELQANTYWLTQTFDGQERQALLANVRPHHRLYTVGSAQ